MPCLFAILTIAFPRVAILLLWFFTSFFNGVFRDLLVPILGFILLPLTLIAYTYLHNTHASLSAPASLVILFIAVILDLGLVGGGRFRRSGSA